MKKAHDCYYQEEKLANLHELGPSESKTPAVPKKVKQHSELMPVDMVCSAYAGGLPLAAGRIPQHSQQDFIHASNKTEEC